MANVNLVLVDTEQTVFEWLSQWTISNFTPKQFLDLPLFTPKGTVIAGVLLRGITNFDVIVQHYNKEEYAEVLGKSASGGGVKIKAGTTVGMPNSAIKRQLIRPNILPEPVEFASLKPFMTSALRDLLTDPNYVRVVRDVSGQSQVRQDINDISVYVWIRSITNPMDNSQEGAWYDISAFVNSVSTFVTSQGGSFTLSLTPIVGVYDKQVGWSVASVSGYETGSVREDVIGIGTISKHRANNDNFLARNDFFFSRTLQENDLVYIRFEGIEAERQRNIYQRAFGGQDVPGNIYDMIGLIDAVNDSGSQNNQNIAVFGRDLMKVLIEDGSTFFPEQAGQQIFTDPNSLLTRRNLIESNARLLASAPTSFKFINTILKYIFNKFSNIGMVPSHAFNGYGERAEKKKYKIVTNNVVVNELNIQFARENREGVWRIIEFVFDKDASQRVLADSSLATDNGSIINSIRKICQEPFIEFSGDTYGDKYYFTVRKLPFDSVGYRGMIYNDVVSDNLFDSVNTLGNISKTKNRLLGSVKKSVDVLAKKASTFNQFKQQLNRKTKTLIGRNALISDLVIDIDESDVISDNLVYSNQAYSWYRLTPRGVGNLEASGSFLLAPAIPFDEYAEIWGNKSYDLEYNYTPSEFIDDSFSNKNLKYVESQTFLDLQYIIQSNAYLPFTREGTITINGDRRIKRGTMIYYKPTNEIFYVEAVGNDRTVNDRWTTLTVRRGMIEKYIRGFDVPFIDGLKKVSYFDIIKTDIPNNASISNTDFLKNWRVEKNVFNFFLQRRQWVE